MPRVTLWIPEELHTAAKAAGLSWSAVMREALSERLGRRDELDKAMPPEVRRRIGQSVEDNRAVLEGLATPDQAEAEARRILAQHQPKPALDLPPIPQPSVTGCTHPKGRRERKDYGTICGACGHLVAWKGV